LWSETGPWVKTQDPRKKIGDVAQVVEFPCLACSRL
jgi:hypothetical protein